MSMKNEELFSELENLNEYLLDAFIEICLGLKKLIPEDEYNKLISNFMFFDVIKDK